MAKKITNEEVVIQEPIAVSEPPKKAKPIIKDSWEIKDRTYILTGPHSPLTYKIPSRHTLRHSLLK